MPRISVNPPDTKYSDGEHCPRDSARLVHTEQENETWEHKCPQCGAVFTGPAYDGFARGLKNFFLSVVAADLAWVYAIEHAQEYLAPFLRSGLLPKSAEVLDERRRIEGGFDFGKGQILQPGIKNPLLEFVL